MGELLLVRHGETTWSRSGQHTGRTDLPLTDLGELQATALATELAGRTYAAVLTSPLLRARRTAELSGLSAEVDPDLAEWDYGDYEGQRTAEIRAERRDDWWVFTDGAPGGEDWRQVGARCERVLTRVAPLAAGDDDVLLFGHGHALRVLTATWLELPAWQGGLFALDPASLSILSHYHGRPVVRRWNDVSTHPPEER
ncbi:MAG: histidine phosphatase family protein [Frankiales bacterium]|nr:histidine phosphatase family protein [Frankiales bacterium]